MKYLYKILLTTLVVNFIYPQLGQRENRQGYNIIKKSSFSDVIGWSKRSGQWTPLHNRIYFRDFVILYDLELSSIEYYEVKEDPDHIILSINNYSYYVINKNDLKDVFQFEKNNYSQIRIPYICKGIKYTSSQESIQYVDKLFYDFRNEESECIRMYSSDDFLIVNYYQYDDKIQYLLSQQGCWYDHLNDRECGKNWIVSKLLSNDLIIQGEEDLGNKYFESPFNEFKSFFDSLIK